MADVVSFSTLREAVRRDKPQLALVLGSGLSTVAGRLRPAMSVPFGAMPGLDAPSVSGHKGILTLGKWVGRWVLVFEGRLHYYEGHPWRTVVEPIHLVQHLGVPVVVLTNAAGGIHDALDPGSFMALRDHIDWTRPYAWRHPGPGGLGPPRPSPYSARLLSLLVQAGQNQGIRLVPGIYAQVTGPAYETPAEIRALKIWGADAVGMSTAREIQTACDLGLECAALSCITNRAAGLSEAPLDHGAVLSAGRQFSDRAGDLLQEFVRLL